MARNAAFSLFSSPVVVIASLGLASGEIGTPVSVYYSSSIEICTTKLTECQRDQHEIWNRWDSSHPVTLLSSANPVWSNGPMTVPDSIQCTLASYCPAAELSSSLHIVRVDRRRRSESGSRDRHHPIWCSPLISTDIKTGRDSDWPKLVAMRVKRGKMLFLFSIQQRSIDRSVSVSLTSGGGDVASVRASGLDWPGNDIANREPVSIKCNNIIEEIYWRIIKYNWNTKYKADLGEWETWMRWKQ